MRFNVHVMPIATRELDHIIAWVADRSPSGAARLLGRFHQSLKSLETNPHRHGIAPESELVGREIRQMFFKTRKGRTYRALFDIHDDLVRVLHVRGPGQDLIDPEDW